MNKKIFAIIVFVVIGILIILSAYRRDPSQVTIGLILPLSGDAAAVGISAKNAAELAKEHFGTTKYSYNLVFEDDQADSKNTVSAFQKLRTTNNISAITAAFSGPSNAIAPLGENEKIITFTIASDMTIAKGKPYVFNHWIKPDNEAEVYVREARRRGLKKIAIFATNQQGVIAIRDALLGIDPSLFLLKDNLIQENDKDFRTSILKAKQLETDSFVLLLVPGQLSSAVKQIREVGMSIPITGIESFEYDAEAIPLLEGQWYVNADDPSDEFIQRYQKVYGSFPQIGAGNTYDIISLLITAFEDKGNNPENAGKALSKIQDFPGVMGTLSIDPDGNIDSQAVVKEVRSGKFVKLSE